MGCLVRMVAAMGVMFTYPEISGLAATQLVLDSPRCRTPCSARLGWLCELRGGADQCSGRSSMAWTGRVADLWDVHKVWDCVMYTIIMYSMHVGVQVRTSSLHCRLCALIALLE